MLAHSLRSYACPARPAGLVCGGEVRREGGWRARAGRNKYARGEVRANGSGASDMRWEGFLRGGSGATFLVSPKQWIIWRFPIGRPPPGNRSSLDDSAQTCMPFLSFFNGSIIWLLCSTVGAISKLISTIIFFELAFASQTSYKSVFFECTPMCVSFQNLLQMPN